MRMERVVSLHEMQWWSVARLGLFLLLLAELLLGHPDEPVETQGGEDVEDDEGPEDAARTGLVCGTHCGRGKQGERTQSCATGRRS